MGIFLSKRLDIESSVSETPLRNVLLPNPAGGGLCCIATKQLQHHDNSIAASRPSKQLCLL